VIQTFFQEHFYALHATLGVLLIYFLFSKFNNSESKTQFRVRESERDQKFKRGLEAQSTNHAKKKPSPFLLTGIRTEGEAHEILGVSPLATESEIQKAHRELIKRYHPDKVARPNTQAWKDAQLIAEKLNEAKSTLLQKAKKRNPPS
jgi:DnaJ-class molecular chaperone